MSSLVTVLIDAPVMREMARIDIPSRRRVRIWVRVARDSLFMFKMIQAASINIKGEARNIVYKQNAAECGRIRRPRFVLSVVVVKHSYDRASGTALLSPAVVFLP